MIDIRLLDITYLFQAFQFLVTIGVLIWVMVLIAHSRKFTRKLLLTICAGIAVSLLAAGVVYGLEIYDYIHSDRPIYQSENRQMNRQRR